MEIPTLWDLVGICFREILHCVQEKILRKSKSSLEFFCVWDTLYLANSSICVWDTLYLANSRICVWDTLYLSNSSICVWNTLYLVNSSSICVWDTLYLANSSICVWDTLYLANSSIAAITPAPPINENISMCSCILPEINIYLHSTEQFALILQHESCVISLIDILRYTFCIIVYIMQLNIFCHAFCRFCIIII